MRSGQAEGRESSWRGLYACRNGWRGLRPGYYKNLELPGKHEIELGYPTHCVLDSEGLGWTRSAGVAPEWLVVFAPTLCRS
ncbi:hypothetical protein WJX81_003372 [Elliptochloris bilobata]|uniref:Uncharacterized protein n=1 Tax=Elliptochloris bilobata TaxID=381761 RepID=A0AAW1RRB2_9CHLO